MKRKTALLLAIGAILFSCLAGCGVAPEKYDQMAAQFQKAQEEITRIRGETDDLTAEKETAAAQLETALAEAAELEGQLGVLKEQLRLLKEQYELVGATKAETAENVVSYYHETHVYSTHDFFTCGDMASEVWNMLKAQGIDAKIMIGNKDAAIGDILDSNHAWVLAEVAPGEDLALETTGGYAVTKIENALYYRGWSFDSPARLKSHNELVREYNVRVGIHNDIVAEDRDVIDEYNQATNPQTVAKLEAVHLKLIEMIEAQEAELNNIKAELTGLATKCGT